MDLAPPRGETSKPSTIKRPAKPVSARTSGALLAGQPFPNNAKARPPSWRVGAFGYAINGLALLFLSLWAFSHFGQVFWFFSLVSAALGVNSLHGAHVLVKGAPKPKTIQTPSMKQGSP